MQLHIPVEETAIRDTMRAVFRQAAYVKRQPSWLARKFSALLGWILDQLRRFGGTHESDPVLFWTIVVLVSVVAVAIVGRLAYVSWRRRAQGIDARFTAPDAPVAGGRDPWLMAQQYAASGDFTSAAHALYAALLGAIARRGLVRLHPSKTVGDYVRELRSRSADVFTRFRQFARAYETVVYGTGVCDAERYETLQRLALPIVKTDG